MFGKFARQLQLRNMYVLAVSTRPPDGANYCLGPARLCPADVRSFISIHQVAPATALLLLLLRACFIVVRQVPDKQTWHLLLCFCLRLQISISALPLYPKKVSQLYNVGYNRRLLHITQHNRKFIRPVHPSVVRYDVCDFMWKAIGGVGNVLVIPLLHSSASW